MKEAIVVDSACLIGLERIGQLALLPALYGPLLIPPEVAREIGFAFPWLNVETPVNTAFVTTLKLLVDDGEAEAIALASERASRIILDDKQARALAQKLGLNIIGTVGVLVRAKLEGVMPALRPLLDALDANSFRVSKALRDEALRLAGE